MDKTVVLVVEDEALIRMDARHMIEDAGYAVVEACDADEAITALVTRSDIRAVFTDISMPGSMSGWQLAHTVRRRWPPIHLIVTSGLQAPTDPPMPADARFIAKPYGFKQLASALWNLLGEGPRPAFAPSAPIR